jgi:hypothetical protein
MAKRSGKATGNLLGDRAFYERAFMRRLVLAILLVLSAGLSAQYSSLRFYYSNYISRISALANGDLLVHRGSQDFGDQGIITRVDPQGNAVWSYTYGPKVKSTWGAVEMDNGEILCMALFQDTLVSGNYICGVLRLTSAGVVIRARGIQASSSPAHSGGYWTAGMGRIIKHDTDQGYHINYHLHTSSASVFYRMSSTDELIGTFKDNGHFIGWHTGAVCKNGSLYVSNASYLAKMTFGGTVLWAKKIPIGTFSKQFTYMSERQNELYVVQLEPNGMGRRPGLAVFDTTGTLLRSSMLDLYGVDNDPDPPDVVILDEGPVLSFSRGPYNNSYGYVAKLNTALTTVQMTRQHVAAGCWVHNIVRTAENGLAVLFQEPTIEAKLLTRIPPINVTNNPTFFIPCWTDSSVTLVNSPMTMTDQTPWAMLSEPSTLVSVNVTSSAFAWSTTVECTAAQVGANANVRLEGSYNPQTGNMSTALMNQGLLPLTEPYTALGYAQFAGGGGETTTNSVLTSLGAVDWVRLELRSANTPGTILATRQALLRSNGEVWSANGQQGVRFGIWRQPGVTYYLAVRHRNHLGAMLAAPIGANAPSVPMADLTNTSAAVYGTTATKIIGSSRVLWMGNASPGNMLSYTGANNDRDPILVRVGSTTPNATVTGYFREDTNLDGLVKYAGASNDRDPILVNIGSATPNATRVEQLP